MLTEANPKVVQGCALAASLATGALLLHRHLTRKRWIRVGKVDELCVYPIKGGKVKSVTSAHFEKMGIRAAIFRDRTFGLMNDR